MAEIPSRLRQSARSILIITACAATVSCETSRMWWPGHTAQLRTALVKYDVDEGVIRARMVLSTGLFQCELPVFDQPAEAEDAQQDLLNGACREGAAHLSVQLLRRSGPDWTGRYRGQSEVRGDTLPLDQKRAADASWYTVNEAYLVEFGPLDRAMVVEDMELMIDIGDGGTVEITRDREGLKGHLWFPEPGVSADFDTEVCGEGSTLFDLLEASPVTFCP
jgi:hypothetical protein